MEIIDETNVLKKGVIAEMSLRTRRMVTAAALIRRTVHGSAEEASQIEAANNSIELFTEYLNANSLLIDTEIASYFRQMRDAVDRYMRSLNILSQRGSKLWGDAVERSINIGSSVFEREIPALLHQLDIKLKRYESIMKAIIQKTVEIKGRKDTHCHNKYTEIDFRITTIRFLSIPVYQKAESFSD